MTRTNYFIRGLIKGGVIVIMILSLPVKVYNYLVDLQWKKQDKKLQH